MSLRADRGVSMAGLMMTELPAARAGPTLWHTKFRGKLNGAIAATTPQGTRTVKPKGWVTPGAASRGTVSPWMRLDSSDDRVMVWTALDTSVVASARVLPSSMEMVLARSRCRSASMSAALRRMV